MRLIDADALIEIMGLANAVKWGNKDGYQQDRSYSTMMRYEIKDEIDAQPTVPAVPLDKLCEWLDKNNDFVPFCADDKADCNSCELEGAECIKKRIMLWMEGLDAPD